MWGIGHYQSQCPSFEAVADSKRSKWNTPRPRYSGVHVDCDRQPPSAVVRTNTSTDSHSVYVDAKISGHQVRCLVDTGSRFFYSTRVLRHHPVVDFVVFNSGNG